jgi:flagellar hook-length control protein FliK
MKESVFSVGGNAPPTTSPKPVSRKAPTVKSGLQFDAYLREEVQPRQFQDVDAPKEDPKPEKCQTTNPDNSSHALREDKSINPVLCNPTSTNIQQNPTPDPLEMAITGNIGSVPGDQAAQPDLLKVDPDVNKSSVQNFDLPSDLAAAAKEAATQKSQATAGKEADTANLQTAPVQSGKTQFRGQLAEGLDQPTTDIQTTGEIRPAPKSITASSNPSAVNDANSSSELSGQMSFQTAQKPVEEKNSQIASTASNSTNSVKKEGQEAAAKLENAPPVTSGLEKTGFTEANKNVEPARLAEARAPELMSQILDGLETLVKNKNVMVRLQLYPDELGHIELKVVSNSQGLEVFLRADRLATQQLLESQLGLLRQTLTSAGLNPAQIDVGQGSTNRSSTARDPRRSARKLFKDASRSGSGNPNQLDIPILGRNSSEIGLDYKI